MKSNLSIGMTAAGLISGAVALTAPAEACGGLFCDSSNPVNQAAERIIFAQNDDDTVTAIVEILYEGPSSRFAWVLPVPAGELTVGVSSKNALDRLDAQSNPRYQLNQSFSCDGDDDSATADSPGESEDAKSPDEGGVVVIAEGNAGPYDWVQLEVDPKSEDPAEKAILWLEENKFDVSALAPQVLAEYLEDGMNLIAFKLQKGKNEGSVRPVLLTYEGQRLMIPIKPTALAANADMGVKVWTLGDSRAVPSNYLHLELNESLINWFNPNTNYNDVVIRAADDAGGQGFVTEQSGAASDFAGALYQDFEAANWQELRTGQFESLAEFFERARDYFSDYDGFNDVMLDEELIPLREGATHEQFLQCVRCYFETDVPVRNEAYPTTDYPGKEEDPIHGLEVNQFLDDFYRLVIEPLELTRELFETHEQVTRFYTTLSPDEMTMDPEFEFNPDLPDVSNVHTATQILSCEDDGWTIELPQGMVVRGEEFGTWPIATDSKLPANMRVLQLSGKGEGKVVEDNSDEVASLLTELGVGEAMPPMMTPNEDESGAKGVDASGGGGCGVAKSPNSSLGWLLLAVAAVLKRRRR